MNRYPALINGEEVNAGADFEDLDPSTGEILAEVTRGGPQEIDDAVAAARQTLEGTWRRTRPAERARILRRMSDLMRRDRDQLADLESRDTGKPLRQARADADVAIRYFEFYASAVEVLYGETIPVSSDVFIYTLREPFGVTGHIIPWNYPLQIGARTVAPALAAGNCCVLKPAEEAPLTAVHLGRIALEAGLPPGALNVVPGYGEEAGAALAPHPGLRRRRPRGRAAGAGELDHPERRADLLRGITAAGPGARPRPAHGGADRPVPEDQLGPRAGGPRHGPPDLRHTARAGHSLRGPRQERGACGHRGRAAR